MNTGINGIYTLQEALHFIDYQQHIIHELKQASTAINYKYDQVVQQLSELILRLIQREGQLQQSALSSGFMDYLAEYPTSAVSLKHYASDNISPMEQLMMNKLQPNQTTTLTSNHQDGSIPPTPAVLSANHCNERTSSIGLNEPLDLCIKPKAQQRQQTDFDSIDSAELKLKSSRQVSNDSEFIEATSLMTSPMLVRPCLKYKQQKNITQKNAPPFIFTQDLYASDGDQTLEGQSSTEDIEGKKAVDGGINGLSRLVNSLTRKQKKPKIFACEKCTSTFHHKCNLTRHIRIHNNERPYICEICNDSFVQRCHLTCHMRIHTGEKPFKCPHCDARFRHKSNVKCHVRIHTGEKPYKCNICCKAFGQKGQLTCHIASHTGLRPHQCTQCESKFTHRAHLSAHMRVHTGARPFTCTQCSRAFSQKGNLKSHMKRHGVAFVK